MLYSGILVGSRWKIQDRRQINNTDNTQTKHNPEKANNTKHSKTKLHWFNVTFYNTPPGNEVGLFYNAPEPTWGNCFKRSLRCPCFHEWASCCRWQYVWRTFL